MTNSAQDLLLEVNTKKKALYESRLQNTIGELKDNSKIKKQKLVIARLMTIVSQKRREEKDGKK
ncbi:50S ribosomal protein L29 [Candidatus Marinamargulisbacteria bacterium SCGC AAA071-K20]|nr:50S ribosomal protein L29 [Candidatus Marinamargulisbacteria bacterium SCGC AAA071-K20]